jgi:NodT family efflux transporter outer membrane factor (OMF) lipoprotein
MPTRFATTRPGAPEGVVFWGTSFPSQALARDTAALRRDNLELAAARMRVEQARQAYGVARSEQFPTLDGTAGFDRSRTKNAQGRTTVNVVDFGAALNWELDVWGRLRAQREASDLSIREQEALLDQVALDLQTLLVEAWIENRSARDLAEVLETQRQNNRKILELLEFRARQGQSTALDVLQQRGRLASVERLQPTTSAAGSRAGNAYAVLMGHYPGKVAPPEDACPVLAPLAALPTPQHLLANRPDLRAAHLALQAADSEVAAAIANRLPRLSIGLSHVVSGSDLGSVGDGSVQRFTVGLLAPVFAAGRLKAEEAQRRAEALELLALLEQALREAVREVEDALAQEQALFEESTLLQLEIAIAQESVEKAGLRYLNGSQPYLVVLDTLRGLQELQQEEIALQQALLVNRASLLKAIGADWSHRDETETED